MASIAQRFLSELRASNWARKPVVSAKISLGSQAPQPLVYLRPLPATPPTPAELLAAELDKSYGREQHAKNVAEILSRDLDQATQTAAILKSRLECLTQMRLLRAAWAVRIAPRPDWLDQSSTERASSSS